MNNTRLTKHVFVYDYNRVRNNGVLCTWSASLKDIFVNVDMLDTFESLTLCDLDLAKTRLMRKDSDIWLREVTSKPKLRLYVQIKTEFETEEYVKMNLTRSERSHLSQIRFGILPIMIETGRFRNLRLEERLCPFCDSVEDELHFLFSCFKYDDLREVYLGDLISNDVDNVSNLKNLCSLHPRPLAKYIVNSLNRRRKHLYV